MASKDIDNKDNWLGLAVGLAVGLVGLGLALGFVLELVGFGLGLTLGFVGFGLPLGLALGFVGFGLGLSDKEFKYLSIGLILGAIIGLVIISITTPTALQQNNITTTTILPLNLNCTKLQNFINTNITNGQQQVAQSYIQIAQSKGCIKGGT